MRPAHIRTALTASSVLLTWTALASTVLAQDTFTEVETEAVEAVEATEAEVTDAVEAEATEAVEATEEATTEAVEAVEAEATDAVEAVEAEATEAVEAVEAEATEAVEAVEAEATEAVEAVEAVEAEETDAVGEANETVDAAAAAGDAAADGETTGIGVTTEALEDAATTVETTVEAPVVEPPMDLADGPVDLTAPEAADWFMPGARHAFSSFNGSVAACVATPHSRRARVLNVAQVSLDVDADNMISNATFLGEDPDGEIQTCVAGALDGQSLDQESQSLEGHYPSVTFHTSTYDEQHHHREGEIVGLGVFSVAALVGARYMFFQASGGEGPCVIPYYGPDEVDDDDARTLRAAGSGLAVVGVMGALGTTMLYLRHRQLERRDNPTLAITPVAMGEESWGVALGGRF